MDADVIGDLLFSPLNPQESLDDMQHEDSGDEQMLGMFEDCGGSEDDLFETGDSDLFDAGDDYDLFDADDECDLFDVTLEETSSSRRLLLDTADMTVLLDDDLFMQECDGRSLDAATQPKDECKQQHRDR
jgi:hypothetical protein